jgi:hypothetical protein
MDLLTLDLAGTRSAALMLDASYSRNAHMNDGPYTEVSNFTSYGVRTPEQLSTILDTAQELMLGQCVDLASSFERIQAPRY